MIRVFAIILLSSVAAFAALYFSSGNASPILNLPIGVVAAVGAMIAALSVGFHTFIDGIAKDLPDKEKVRDVAALNSAIEKLGNLRKEVIENAALVVAMVIAYVLLYGIRETAISSGAIDLVQWILISLSFGCFVVIVFAAFIQLRGYQEATELRSILARNK